VVTSFPAIFPMGAFNGGTGGDFYGEVYARGRRKVRPRAGGRAGGQKAEPGNRSECMPVWKQYPCSFFSYFTNISFDKIARFRASSS